MQLSVGFNIDIVFMYYSVFGKMTLYVFNFLMRFYYFLGIYLPLVLFIFFQYKLSFSLNLIKWIQNRIFLIFRIENRNCNRNRLFCFKIVGSVIISSISVIKSPKIKTVKQICILKFLTINKTKIRKEIWIHSVVSIISSRVGIIEQCYL